MGFYSVNPTMQSHLIKLLDQLEKKGFSRIKNRVSITWIRYDTKKPAPFSGAGAGWAEERLVYPASVVKIFYGIACEAWLQRDLLQENKELIRAAKEMIQNSSNDATSLVVDLLTGTTSGPTLVGDGWQQWKKQRLVINSWLSELGWPELKAVNCCQKTWSEGPFGRDNDFYGPQNGNRNSLTTTATARLLESIMTDNIVSPAACRRQKEFLSRSVDLGQRQSDPENQVDGFLGEALPKGSQLWSKAGLMSQARHDAAWFSIPGENPMLLVVFSSGKELASNKSLLPLIAKELIKINQDNEDK